MRTFIFECPSCRSEFEIPNLTQEESKDVFCVECQNPDVVILREDDLDLDALELLARGLRE